MSIRKLRLDGKSAMITGGAGEIGRAIAIAYLEEGASVVLTGRTREKLEKAVHDLLAENSGYEGRLTWCEMDNSKELSVQQAFREVSSRFGELDILINNAGTAGPAEELANIPLTSSRDSSESLGESINSLLLGPWLVTRVFLPVLKAGASIINISTIFSRSPYYGRAPYVVPKAALNALTKLMAQELGLDRRRIRVNTVYPGPVETERIQRVFSAMDNLRKANQGTTKSELIDRMIMKETVDGRLYIPREDVAKSLVFLGSDESCSYTSHDFEVTRGFRTEDNSVSNLASSPKVSAVALSGRLTWIIAGSKIDDVCEFVERLRKADSEVFITFQDASAVAEARARLTAFPEVKIQQWNPRNPFEWEGVENYLRSLSPTGWSVVIMPLNETFRGSQVLGIKPKQIREFVESEIEPTVVVAKRLEELFKFHDAKLLAEPTVVFLSDKSDGEGNVFARLKRAAIQQLIRTWRHENEIALRRGVRSRAIRVNQLIRYENEKPGNWDSCIDWIISLSDGVHVMGAIDLVLDRDLNKTRTALLITHDSAVQNLVHNLHLDRVALITGGSEGIGGAIARMLALSGARVVIAERSEEKLARTKERLVSQLKEARYPDPEGRILTMGCCDVSREETLREVVDRTIEKFGRVDFLVNNAGLVGGEEMAVDLSPQVWQQTISGNLLSNYQLLLLTLPHMKRQQFGHIINMSSYFGGTRHGAIPYTNRSDYAVSKAGQIALVQAVCESIGPDVQINAVAPGPVDGARLNGTQGRPGLYQRRARLLLDNKRLVAVYAAAHASLDAGMSLSKVMSVLCANRLDAALQDATAPGPLRELAKSILSEFTGQSCGAGESFLNLLMFRKLLGRFERLGMPISFQSFLERFVEAREPFFPTDKINLDATSIRNRMIDLIALRRMPTDFNLASEVVSALAHRTMTGEVVFATGGFNYPGYMLGDSFGCDPIMNLSPRGYSDAEAVAHLSGSTVYISGDAMYEEMSQLAIRYSHSCRVIVLTFSEAGRKEIERRTSAASAKEKIRVLFDESRSISSLFDSAVAGFGRPDAVISFPMGDMPPLEVAFLNGGLLPSYDGFKSLVDSNVTNHFLLARKICLIDNCRGIFVTHPLNQSSREHSAWARFVRDSLRPFTLAAGKESGHLPHRAKLFQIGTDSSDEGFYRMIIGASMPDEMKQQIGRAAA